MSTASRTDIQAVSAGERAAAARDVENLMSRYEILLAGGHLAEVTEMFALNTPGVRAGMVWGVYDGPENVRKLYVDVHGLMLGDIKTGTIPGALYVQANSTSVVEVAADGETAKGYWICPGLGTKTVGDKRVAHWGWCRRVADFVKEDGTWKIWHYQVVGIFNTPYTIPWTDLDIPDESLDMSWLPEHLRADRPAPVTWVYSADTRVVIDPLPPVPYRTFAETFSY